MIRHWHFEMQLFVLLIATGAAIGWLLNAVGWGVAVMVILYGGWHLLRLRELIRWLSDTENNPVPEAGGIWGIIFENLYRREKKQLERVALLKRAIRRSRQSTNAIPDAVVMLDEQGHLSWWNDAAEHLLGFRKSTDRGQPITNLLRDPRFVRHFHLGELATNVDIPSPHQPHIQLSLHIALYGDGEYLLVARDVTQLQRLEQMRKDFVANVSHELRTPLTVVKGYLETFLNLMSPDSNRQLYRGLNQMNQQTQRMEMLINDLLLLSRLENDALKPQLLPVPIPQLIRQLQQDAKVLNEDKQHQIVLDIDEELHLLGDESQLRSAFSNLIVNAIKYTPAGGTITLRWYHDGHGAHFAVEDSGEGIDPIHLPRLTERFYRVDQSRHTQTGGTGLGLAIVKHVMIHHEGELAIASQLLKGSCFTCHFPVKRIIIDSTPRSLPKVNQKQAG